MFGFGKKKTDLFDALYRGAPEPAPTAAVATTQPEPRHVAIEASMLPAAAPRQGYHTGDKWHGSFGPTQVLWTDYWTLRARSAQLFRTNLYARGIIRRLVTAVINTGLALESMPEEKTLGYEEDELADWSEDIETRFEIWGSIAGVCDHAEQRDFGTQQQDGFAEALIAGDVLCVLRQDARTQLPRVQLINGAAVRSPWDAKPRKGNTIVHGVELDPQRRHVAYWITGEDGKAKRLPAYGEKSGRRLAWLAYGTDKRLDDVRGEPLLSVVLHALNDVDRYRDATLRKAAVNSLVAMYVTRDQANMPSRSLTMGGAVRKGAETTVDTAGTERSWNTMEMRPGLAIDTLAPGEDIKGFPSTGTDEKFGDFEAAILNGVAWALEIPPEILRQSFNSNYSASQAANNEFDAFRNKARTTFGNAFCQPIYREWLISEVLAGRVDAPGLIEAWRSPAAYAVLGAWLRSDWSGHIKPSVDPLKRAKAYKLMVDEGFILRSRATRELTGMKLSTFMRRQALENQQLAEARAPLAPAVQSPEGDDGEPDDDETDIDRTNASADGHLAIVARAGERP